MYTTCSYLYKKKIIGRVTKWLFVILNITQVLFLTQCLVSQECHGFAFTVTLLNNYILMIKKINIILNKESALFNLF